MTLSRIDLPHTFSNPHMHTFFSSRTLKLSLWALLFSVFSLSFPTAHALVPSGTSVSIDEGTLTNTTSINLTLTASGPAVIEMQIDPGSGVFGAWEAFVTNKAISLPAGDGLKTVNVNFRDQANPLDVAGPESDTITLDQTSPTLNPVSIASDNALNPTTQAKTGDTITVSFTSNEPITSVSSTIATEVATVLNTGGNNWTATLLTDGNEPQGALAFTIDFQDIAGNTGTQVVASTDASSINFDSVAPTATPVTIASDNANSTFAKIGDTVTVSFTASETLDPSTNGTIGGQSATISGGTAFLLTTGAETEGALTFSINIIDPAGNTGILAGTTDASSVIFDKTSPVFDSLLVTAQDAGAASKALAPDGNFYIKNGEKLFFSFSINPADTVNTGNNIGFNIGATPQTTSNFVSSTTPVTNRTRTYTLTSAALEGAVVVTGATFLDQAGNALTGFMAPVLTIIADQTAPTLTTVSIASDNAISPMAYAKTNDTVTVSFTSSEGIQNVSATIDGEIATVTNTGGNNWTATLLTSGDETEGVPLTFTIDFEDYATNPGTQVTSVTDASSIIFDMTDPMITSVNHASDNTFFLGDAPTTYSTNGDDLIITATVSDTISGIKMTDATFFLGVTGQVVVPFVNTVGSTWVATYTANGTEQQGVVPFDATATDNAGNLLTVSSTTDGSNVVHDYTNPTLPTSVVDLDGPESLQFKHRTKAEYSWSGEADPIPGGVTDIAGLLHFDIDYVHSTNLGLSNELNTIVVLPTTSFVPAASLLTADNNPYVMSMEVFDKAGNGSGKSVIYTQKYTIAIIGKITDLAGNPISGASAQIAARAGEVCLVGIELCGAITGPNGDYFLLLRDTANYTLSFSSPNHFLAKQDVFIPPTNDVVINPRLEIIAGNLTQHTTQVVRIKTSQTYTAADGSGHPTFIDVLALGGQISINKISASIFEVSSLSRITSIVSNNPHVVITFKGNNTYEITGAGEVTGTSSDSGGEGSQGGASNFGTSPAHGSGASRIGTRQVSGSGKTSLRITGQSREDYRRLNKEFMTYAESLAAAMEMNQGIVSRVLAYVNRNGYITFQGYQSGRLPLDKVGKRYQNQVRPSGRFVVRSGQSSLAQQAENLKALVQREEPAKEKRLVANYRPRRARAGDEFVSVINHKLKRPLYVAHNKKFRYVNHIVTNDISRIQGKDMDTVKINIGGKKLSVSALVTR
ncbi:MAG TPA: hypothetical protein VIT68_00255 [Candidatus Gracilibacteria bacterium]